MKNTFLSIIGFGFVLGLIAITTIAVSVVLALSCPHSDTCYRIELSTYFIRLLPVPIAALVCLSRISKGAPHPVIKFFLIIASIWVIEIWIMEFSIVSLIMGDFNFNKYLGTDTNLWYFAGLRHLFLILIFAIIGFALDRKDSKDSK